MRLKKQQGYHLWQANVWHTKQEHIEEIHFMYALTICIGAYTCILLPNN